MKNKKLYFFVIVILLLCLSAQKSYSQIAELKTNLTEQDTKEVLDLLGITVAELPLKVQKGDYFVDFYLDEYRGEELISSQQFLNKKTLEQFGNFAISSFLPKVNDSTSHLSIYSVRKNDSLEVFKVKSEKVSWKKELKIDSNEDYEWKTFLDKEVKPEVKIPILSLFSIWDQEIANSTVRRACLPNLPPDELGKILSHYYVFSVKLVSEVQ